MDEPVLRSVASREMVWTCDRCGSTCGRGRLHVHATWRGHPLDGDTTSRMDLCELCGVEFAERFAHWIRVGSVEA